MLRRIVLCLILVVPLVTFGQTKKITGKITDENGLGIPGVTVLVKGKKAGTASNANAEFEIAVTPGEVLVFSAVGFETKEITVTALSTSLSIVLNTSAQSMETLVVIGYGTQKRKDVTAAISSVSAKDFKEQPVVNISQVLQGRVPGVQVVSSAGAPGGAISVRIRGSNSIKGDNNPLYVIDGFVGADPNTINPGDIETMDILKDASATAIYGSRGANGVVLITTKRGTAGKTAVSVMSQFTSAKRLKKLDLLNAADFATTVNERNSAIGSSPVFSLQQIEQFRLKGGTDWQDEIFRTSPTQEHQVDISGGNDKTTYYTSGNFLDQNGIILNSYLKRYSLRASINSKLYKSLSLYINAYAVRRETNNTGITGRNSPVTQSIAWSPTESIRNAAGKFSMNDPYSSITFNPVAIATDQDNIVNNSTFSTIAGLKYQFIPGLTLDVSGAINYNNVLTSGYTGTAVNTNLQANASRSSSESIGLQSTNNLTYSKSFNNAHNLTATGVVEYQSFQTNAFNALANNLIYPNLGFNNLSQAQTYNIGANYSGYELLSYLGRISYDYKGKYFLTAALRHDGSSKFQAHNQYSSFPSASVAWKLSETKFVKNMNFFDNLKIRAGFGITGNQAINPYQTLLVSYQNVNTFLGGTALSPGVVLGNPGNVDLSWERTKQWDIGLDADLLKNRLLFSFDYYNKNTDKLLLDVPVPMYLGGGSILSNVGKVNNKGFDFSLTGVILKETAVTWTSSVNLSLLQNKVVQLYNNSRLAANSNVGSGLSSQSEFMIITGQPMGTYWGLTYLGTWKPDQAAEAAGYGNVPGDGRYADLDGNKIIDGNDYQIIGHGLPRHAWGLNNTVTWKGLTLNVFIQSIGGYDKLNYTYAAGITANADIRQATISDIKNRYIPGVNETSDIPAFSRTNKSYTVSTQFLENGSFIRFKNISLSYQLPKSLLKGLDVSLYLRGTNLFTITKYKGFDPESTNASSGAGGDVTQSIDYGSYPNAKSITGGIKVNF